MKTNQMTWALAAALTTSSLFIACDESSELLPDNPDTPQQGETISRYVVAAQSGGSSSTAMYLATSETLDEGTLTTVRLEPHLLSRCLFVQLPI